MAQFEAFSRAVRARVAEMAISPLFVVDADRNQIWLRYLSSFPEGTNLLFKTRTEYDCSCCKSFVRDVGNLVAIQNGALSTVWDLMGLPSPFQEVADAMSEYVRGLSIVDVALFKNKRFGAEITRSSTDDGGVRTWNHFSADLPHRFVCSDPDPVRGRARTTHAVLTRGLTELTPESIAAVAELIEQGVLYRGAEAKDSVLGFQRLQQRYLAAPSVAARDNAAWEAYDSPVARLRNTAIGTLLQELSEGKDLERAVQAYETMVAPQNYKRPTALITPAMVASAVAKIAELGMEPSLERRHARLQDVSVNSVLFVDNAVRGRMKGGLEDLLMPHVKLRPFDPEQSIKIGIDEFVASVLPKTNSLNLFLDNSLAANFVSLTAPVHADVPRLFKWDNDFAWSYDGNVTDSIKEKVKRAGGMVEGVALRISLAWHNTDDLDLHVKEPDGHVINFSSKKGKIGQLDVDMNVHQYVRDAVENVRWDRSPETGDYVVAVHNFSRRESIDVGFTVEIENAGVVTTLRHEKDVPARAMVTVARVTVRSGKIVQIVPTKDVAMGQVSREKWGLRSLDLVRVNSVVLSPNHWTEPGVGAKHWFFVLDGCANPEPTRGVYNEFLSPSLAEHRKVFEVLGDKTKCPPTTDQMSGVGFSASRGDKVTVVAMGPKLQKTYTIAF